MGNFDNSNNRLNDAFVCNGNDGQYTLLGNCTDSYGVCDSGLLSATDANGKETCFFKSTLNVCIIDNSDTCNQQNDGRYANTQLSYVRLSGFVASCAHPSIAQETIILFPTDGQTLVELKQSILVLIGRDCD